MCCVSELGQSSQTRVPRALSELKGNLLNLGFASQLQGVHDYLGTIWKAFHVCAYFWGGDAELLSDVHSLRTAIHSFLSDSEHQPAVVEQSRDPDSPAVWGGAAAV